MEYTRSIKITLEKNTNKSSTKEVLRPYEDESIQDFIKRVESKIQEIYLNEY